jgi:glycosyltransferase involved in cell wall biosynthesis
MSALRKLGIETSVLFSQFYGDGARAFANVTGVTVGLGDEDVVAKLLGNRFDAISVIDYPDFFDTLDRYAAETPVLFETHCAVPRALGGFYRHVDHSRVRAVVVPSHHNERLIRERLNPACDVLVIPNPVDTQVFRPGDVVSQKCLPPALFGGDKLILWVGRLEDEKNPYELIDIAEKLLERKTDTRFVVVGDLPGSYDERREHLLDRMTDRTRKSFTFIRTVPYERMPDLYRLVSRTGGALISTSLYEALPMIFVEAMACGCPILSTDVGGVRDVILDEATGRLYVPGEIEQAANILSQLLDPANRKTVERMRRSAHRRALRYHSLSAIAKEYNRQLDRLLIASQR